MITGVGTDVVDINRFRSLSSKAEFLEQVFTPAELERARTYQEPDEFFAKAFAVKEALFKAIGCGLGAGSLWKDVQVTSDWTLTLSGVLSRLAQEQSISRIHVTHSHSSSSAVAFVVLETTKEKEIL